jgi:G protein-coupled receptor GPR1
MLATSDGLYPYRRYVYVGSLLVPSSMSSLAFINSQGGYLAQGAYCTLPLRPFWFRLALEWVPRYLIAMIIVTLAIAIYAYVGFEFRRYNEESQSTKTLMETDSRMASHAGRELVEASTPHMTEQIDKAQSPRRALPIAQDIISSPCRELPAVSFARNGPNATITSHSLPGSTTSLPLRRNDTIRPAHVAIPSGQRIHTDGSFENICIASPPWDTRITTTPTQGHEIEKADEGYDNTSPEVEQTMPVSPIPTSLPQTNQRARIRRQLRLLFIYPLVYGLMWLLPFVQHCTM